MIDISDRLEIIEKNDSILRNLEYDSGSVLGNGWHSKVDSALYYNLVKNRAYSSHRIKDLLRAIRNKKNHYVDLPSDLKLTLGEIPDGFLTYFTNRFPNLLIHVYHFLNRQPVLCKDSIFDQYRK